MFSVVLGKNYSSASLIVARRLPLFNEYSSVCFVSRLDLTPEAGCIRSRFCYVKGGTVQEQVRFWPVNSNDFGILIKELEV